MRDRLSHSCLRTKLGGGGTGSHICQHSWQSLFFLSSSEGAWGSSNKSPLSLPRAVQSPAGQRGQSGAVGEVVPLCWAWWTLVLATAPQTSTPPHSPGRATGSSSHALWQDPGSASDQPNTGSTWTPGLSEMQQPAAHTPDALVPAYVEGTRLAPQQLMGG